MDGTANMAVAEFPIRTGRDDETSPQEMLYTWNLLCSLCVGTAAWPGAGKAGERGDADDGDGPRLLCWGGRCMGKALNGTGDR